MNLYNAFIEFVGDVTVLEATVGIGAIVFMYKLYQKVSTKICEKHDTEQEYKSKLDEAYDGVHNKYPEYRQQSLQIQKDLTARMDSMSQAIDVLMQKITKMEDDDDRRERTRLRDLLLQNFRYYTNKDTNPSQTWTRVESETFWELYREYEGSGGNGYMHTDVVPVMQRLQIVDGNR